MALFKILKGQEKNLPANKTEGWAYVTTDEGNMYVDVSASKRVRIGAHADKADVATKAEGDTKSIREIYLAKLKQVTSDGTTFSFRGETGNGTNAPDLISIPLAGDKAGLISNAAQTIKGNKTFANGISFPTIAAWPTPSTETYPIKSQGLSWSGSSDNAAIFYEVQASDKGMLVIESSDDSNAGLEIRNSASKKKVTIIDGRFIGDLTGTADYASKAQGDSQTIRSKYVSSVVKKSGSNYIFTVTKGDGTTNDVDLYFAASASCGGAALSANILNINNTENIGVGRMQFFQKYGDTTLMPDGDWWSLVRLQHGGYASTGYWTEMAYAFHSDTIKFRRNTNGTKSAWRTIAFTDGKIKNAEFADKATGDTTTIRSTYIASIKQVTSNGTTFTFRGYAGDGSEKANLITVPNASTSVAGLITTGAQTIAGNKTFTGQLIKNGVSTTWVNGRNNALLRMISINGYSPAISIKTTNGSWDIGAYNESSYTDDLVFSYVTDANYNAGNNTTSAQIKFLENGHIVASLDGHASSATKATQDGLGQNIADTYIKSIAYVAHATQPKLKYTKGSGGTTELNMPIASATNAGLITTDSQTIAGDKTFTGMIYFPNATSGLAKGIQWTVGDNDFARIRAGATASNNGYLEIATADDATEPIYVRQYSGVFATLKRTLTLLDASGNTRIPGSLYDKNNQELRASLFLASLFTKTSTGTQLIIGGKNTAGTELSTITIPNASTSLAGLVTAGAKDSIQSFSGDKTFNGCVRIKPTSDNGRQGLRIGSVGGWSMITLGASGDIGYETNTWHIANNNGVFYITHNGSNSSSTGILQSDANGNWRIDNSLGIGGKNAAYKLYVNGNSYIKGTLTFDSSSGTTILTPETRWCRNNDNNTIEYNTGLVTTNKSFIEIRGFAPPTIKRSQGDRPAPYGLGFGNGSESAGIMPIGEGDKLQEVMFYGANSGPTIFTWKYQLWEGTTYDSATSNAYSAAMMSLNSKTGDLYIKNTIGINGTNTGYRLYVNNGTTFLGGNTRIQGSTPNLWIKDTNSTANADTCAIIRFGQHNNDNAASIFLNGPTRAGDGGNNMMTIRNNVGNLRLNNHTINTGYLTVGTGTLQSSYIFYANGTSYINGDLTVNGLATINYTKTVLESPATTRQTSADITIPTQNGSKGAIRMRIDNATSNMTTNNPGADGYIATFQWDNNSIYHSQLFLPIGYQINNKVPLKIRGQKSDGTWGSWIHVPLTATSSTDNAVVRFDGTSGNIQNSSAILGDNGEFKTAYVGVNGQNLGYRLYVNGTSYLSGNTDVVGNLNVTGNYYWYGSKNFILRSTANNQEWSFDLNSGTTNYTGTYAQFWSGKLSNTIQAYYTDTGEVYSPYFMGIAMRGNSSYKLSIGGNTRIESNTPNFYITDKSTGINTYSIIRFGTTDAAGTTNTNAAYIFLNGPQRTDDGGKNLMTIRNNVGNLRLNNNVINTGMLTIGQGTLNTNYTTYSAGTIGNLDGLVSFVQNNIIVGNNVDFNTLVTPGCYKVQMSAWGAAATYHSPNEWGNIYSFGLLLVFRGASSDGEKRVHQIYFPHQTNGAHPILNRMHNGANMSTGWQAWTRMSREMQNGTSNRIAYYSSGQVVSSGNNIWTNGTKLGVNTTSEPGYQFYVNGTSYFNGQVTATQFNGALNGNAITMSYPLGFSGRGNNNWTNGDFTSDGFTTFITDWDEPSGGSVYWASNSKGQLSAGIDGYFYQGRGLRDKKLHRCLDTYDLSNTIWKNTDLLDGWHKQDILGTYYVTSGTASLSHYWCKIWRATITGNQYNDIGITIYVQSQYNNRYGLFTWKIRQNGNNNSGAYNFTIALQEHFGNISSTDIRLYYNNSTGLCEVWVNCWGQYGVWNYSVLKKCHRTNQDSTGIGGFYSNNFSTVQTLPTSSYITASYTPFLGNAATATALTTSAGNTGQPIYFSSGKPVAIDWHIGNSGVGEHNANNVTYNFCGYYTSNGPATSLGASTNDGALYAQAYNSTWVGQIAQDYRNGGLYVRGKNNGTWQAWYSVLDTRNYTSILDNRYVNAAGDTITGELYVDGGTTLASLLVNGDARFVNTIQGNISGNAASATKLATARTISLTGSVTGSGTFDGSGNLSIATVTNHVHNFLSYGPTLTSDAAINSFHKANTFQAALWSNTSSPGCSNGIILDMGWASTSFGAQIAIDDDPTYFIALRQKNGDGWKAWKRIPMGDGTGASGTWGISITGNAATATCLNSLGNLSPESGRTSNRGGVYTYNMYNETANGAPSSYLSVIGFGKGTGGHVEIAGYWCGNNGLWYRSLRDTTDNWYAWNRIWVAGNSVTSAVWNDYAECRKSDSQEPGYVMFEKGDDSLSKTIERLQHFAGVVSDTWGFSQGETEEAKTNIAVAGRVLVYPYRDRNEYKPGDCVCAAPGGKVDIMTREEIIQYPDRIVGTVSCVPDYEEWGGGEGADRDPVKVNGRIWIKVR